MLNDSLTLPVFVARSVLRPLFALTAVAGKLSDIGLTVRACGVIGGVGVAVAVGVSVAVAVAVAVDVAVAEAVVVGVAVGVAVALGVVTIVSVGVAAGVGTIVVPNCAGNRPNEALTSPNELMLAWPARGKLPG